MNTHEELMQLRNLRMRKLGELSMDLMKTQGIENLLEATRQQIADQGTTVDARLLEKERMLEQAVIDAYLDEPTKEQS